MSDDKERAMKRNRASEIRAIADGRLLLNVRNGVTVSRSMLAMIADEFEAMSTALAAKDAELAELRQELGETRLVLEQTERNAERIIKMRDAQLAEARKALDLINTEARSFPVHTSAVTRETVLTSKLTVIRDAARRALTGGRDDA